MRVKCWVVGRGLFLLLLVFLAGCSVLTPSQVKEVKRFAFAAQDFGYIPGSVINSYAELRTRERIYSAAGFIPGPNVLPQIESALKARREYQNQAEQSEKAMAILNQYAQLLAVLTSDDFSEDLQEEAENLGKRIDKGIGTFNQESGKEIKAFGGVFAGSIRGVGGLYIKRRQTVVLQEAVSKADPMIEEMTIAVNGLLDLYLPGTAGDGFIRETESSLKKIFEANIQGAMAKEPLFVAMQLAETLEFSENTYKLAVQTKQSIANLRHAHQELMSNLQEKRKIKGTIETVKVFADEVKAANNLKKKLEKE